MKQEKVVAEKAQNIEAADNRWQPKQIRIGVNFQLVIETDEQNIIEITDYSMVIERRE